MYRQMEKMGEGYYVSLFKIVGAPFRVQKNKYTLVINVCILHFIHASHYSFDMDRDAKETSI
jgi:hypothetical protein